MSFADQIYIKNCEDILNHGFRDDDLPVRPHWEDGTPAHTIKLFGIVNRYDLRREFPMMTLRRTYWKSAVDELLWIWQKKSNRVSELKSRIWDSWADENGTIGKAYGYQLGVKYHYPEGDMDQVDRVLGDRQDHPASRPCVVRLPAYGVVSALDLHVSVAVLLMNTEYRRIICEYAEFCLCFVKNQFITGRWICKPAKYTVRLRQIIS